MWRRRAGRRDRPAIRGATVVSGVRRVQVKKTLLVFQGAIGLDLEAIDPVAIVIGYVEQRLVGREREAAGESGYAIRDPFLALGADGPDDAGAPPPSPLVV